MYQGNKVFIKLKDGLLEPFKTTIGVKQGCVFSPILFNLFIDKISSIFDESCAPVRLNNMDLNSLLWADDLVILSRSAEGLQNAITKTESFYKSLGLKINLKKTKILIFNRAGLKLDKKFNFFLAGKKVEISDHYQYLGLNLRPSGSMTFSVQELKAKASKAWYSISKVLYKHKRMEVERALQLYDSLVSPIATYGCEFWLPFSLANKSLKNCENLLSSWESFQPETLNQQCCRLLLSVHKKTSRLAVLGELGRCPALIGALSHCLNYKLNLDLQANQSPILGNLMTEMRQMAAVDQDCWLTRVQKMEKLLGLPSIYLSKSSGKLLKSRLKEKFEVFWLNKINDAKLGPDGINHNKLRTYSKIKTSFSREAYLDLVRNRNQRTWLTRLRTSAHTLAIEKGRYCGKPIEQRICTYCTPSAATQAPPAQPPPTGSTSSGTTPSPQGCIDDEFHFLMKCNTFTTSRNCLFGKIASIYPGFSQLNENQKFTYLLTPKTAQESKLTSKFIKILFEWREKVDQGLSVEHLGIFFS